MSCNYCNLKKGPFKTEKIYTDFVEQVGLLVKERILNRLGEVEPKSPFIELKYQCCKCGQHWILKVPDQAYRGGWFESE